MTLIKICWHSLDSFCVQPYFRKKKQEKKKNRKEKEITKEKIYEKKNIIQMKKMLPLKNRITLFTFANCFWRRLSLSSSFCDGLALEN